MPIKGKTFVITGTLSSLRKDLEMIIEIYEGKLSDTVSKNTDYLIVGVKPGKVEISAVAKYGTQTITEEQFKNMITKKIYSEYDEEYEEEYDWTDEIDETVKKIKKKPLTKKVKETLKKVENKPKLPKKEIDRFTFLDLD